MVMVTFLFTYVVPKFADLFNSLDAKLPTITLFMLAVGQNAQKYAAFWWGVGTCSRRIYLSGAGKTRIAGPIASIESS